MDQRPLRVVSEGVGVFHNPEHFEHRATLPLQIAVLLGLVALCLLVGGTAARVTFHNVGSWYDGLVHPPLSPPNWLFGPVWGLLYLLMAVAAWLVWRTENFGGTAQLGLVFWGAQLAVNGLWTPVFFGLHALAGGCCVIAVLFATLALTINSFRRVNRLAAGLLVPYLVWVSFAGYLNLGFWWLNP